MPYYIAYLETLDKEKDSEILDEHKAYLQKYLEKGKIYAKGPFSDHSGGIIIYKTESEQEAYEIAMKDPVIREGSRRMSFKKWESTLPD